MQSLWVKQLGLLSKLVTEAIAFPLAGAGIGYLIWMYLGVPKWLAITVFSVIGFIYFIYKLYKDNKKQMEDK